MRIVTDRRRVRLIFKNPTSAPQSLDPTLLLSAWHVPFPRGGAWSDGPFLRLRAGLRRIAVLHPRFLFDHAPLALVQVCLDGLNAILDG